MSNPSPVNPASLGPPPRHVRPRPDAHMSPITTWLIITFAVGLTFGVSGSFLLTGLVLGLALGRLVINRRRQTLFEFGIPVTGHVVSTRDDRSTQGQDIQYFVTYTYPLPATGELHTHEEGNLTHGQWSSLRPGQELTILYDAHNPTRCAAYELGLFEVIPNPSSLP